MRNPETYLSSVPRPISVLPVIGDLMAGMLLNRGAAGFVTDGAVRDTPGIIGVGLPFYCAGVSPNSPHGTAPAQWASPSASAESR